MTQYNSLDVKLSNSQLNKLKSAIKNEKKNYFKLFLNNRQVANLCKAFAKHTSTDIKLSKTQLSKMTQSGGFLGRLLGPLLRARLPL